MFEARSTIILRRVLVTLLIGGVMATVTARLFDPERSARQEMLSRQLGSLETTNLRLAQENRHLEGELRLLEHSTEGWKSAARRSQRMLLPGEVIIRFPTD
jgi:cell division protein FtsB